MKQFKLIDRIRTKFDGHYPKEEGPMAFRPMEASFRDSHVLISTGKIRGYTWKKLSEKDYGNYNETF